MVPLIECGGVGEPLSNGTVGSLAAPSRSRAGSVLARRSLSLTPWFSLYDICTKIFVWSCGWAATGEAGD